MRISKSEFPSAQVKFALFRKAFIDRQGFGAFKQSTFESGYNQYSVFVIRKKPFIIWLFSQRLTENLMIILEAVGALYNF